MDYRDFVRKHKESGAAITIAALPCQVCCWVALLCVPLCALF